MRNRTALYALIGTILTLQACGNANEVLTAIPTENESVITQPQVIESTATDHPLGEFFTLIPFRGGIGFRGPWLELYFTDPADPLAQREVGGVDALVAESIVAARQSVDVALKDLRVDSVTSAILAAYRRGVAVRVVTESDSLTTRSKLQVLSSRGVPIVDDQQSGIMNNKFIVIDHNQVWTGSLNYSTPGVFRENNSLIRIYSEEMAANYTKEFDEMFINHQFGPLVIPETPYPSITIQGTQIEVLFSPDDVVVARVTQLLREAQHSIYFLAFSFASQDIGDEIRARAAQGVTVGGILEYNKTNPEATNPRQIEQVNAFLQAGVDVRLDSGTEVMNHKLMIIDGNIVLMGSYDFTDKAETENDENVLIIHSEIIAQKFMEEFLRIQARAQP